MNNRTLPRRAILPLLFLIATAGLQGLTARLEGGQQDGQQEELSLEKLLSLEISTAAKYKQALGDVPASVTVVTSEDIAQFGFRTLADVLQTIPGFYISYDRNYTYLGARGFGRPTDYNNRVLLMLNGHMLNESVYGGALVGTEFGLDLNFVERIEVVRGPGSALYGTNALFAVINVITKRGSDINGGLLSFETGSFGLLKGAAMAGKKLAGGVEFTLAGHWMDSQGPDLYFEEFDSPETNDGLAVGLDWDRSHGLFAALEFRGFSFQGSYKTRTKGVPTASWGVIFNDERAKAEDRSGFVEMKWEGNFGRSMNLFFRGYYDRYFYRGSFPYEEEMTWDKTTDSWLGGETRFRWDIAANNRAIVGMEYQSHLRADYRYWSEETVFADGDWPFAVFSIFAQDELQVAKNLSLTIGLRYDDHSEVKNRFSPRIAVVYHPFPSSTAKFLIGEAFRTPSIYERNYNDPINGFKPNLDLYPEVIRTGELSWEQKFGQRAYGFLSLYRYRMNGLIDWVSDPEDGLIQAQNIGTVDAVGMEAGFNLQCGRDIRIFGSYSWQKPKDLGTDEPLTNAPKHLLKGSLVITLANLLTAGLQGSYESSRLTLIGTRIDPFWLANVNIASRPLFGHLVLSLQVRNIFDTIYGYPGGWEHVQSVIYQNGRSFALRAEYQF